MKLRENIAVIWQVFARDAKRILRSPVALIVILGVCVMPSLYAWYCVAANWDPYQNTASIKVAVANLDEGADSAVAGHLEVGDQVVAKLHDNHQLGWQFTDEAQAKRGVESGEYYAAIIIPPQFSADFTSVFNGDFTRPTIDYYVNEKLSAVAPKVTDSGATAIEEEINRTFVTTVSETVVEMAQKTGTAVEGRADEASGQLADDLGRVRKALDDTQETLAGVGPTVASSREAVAGARDTLGTLEGELPRLSDDLASAQAQLDALRTSAQSYGTELASGMAAGAVALGKAAIAADGAIGQATAELAEARGLVDTALSSARQLIADNDALIAQLEPEAAAYPAIAQALARARDEGARLQQTVTSLEEQAQALGAAADQAARAADAADAAVQEAVGTLEDTSRSLTDSVLPDVSRSLDALSQALGTLRGVVAAVEPEIAQARAALEALDEALGQADGAAQAAGDSLASVQSQLDGVLTDLDALHGSLSVDELADFLGLDAQDVGDFMAAPVSLKTVDVYPVRNYGSGVTPFYTNLALWVAGFILMAIVRIRVDPEGLPPLTITQAYLGRWLLFMALGLIQGLIATIGDLLLGIQCDNPALFVLAGVVTVLVDVNIMFALAYTLKHIGKAIAVILLIVQIPGSSGMFPVEMMPPFFRALNPLLPFTYSIDAMREAIGGLYGLDYWADLGALLLFVPLALFTGLVLGRYAFNLNLLFDEKLGQTGLLDSEEVADGPRRERFRLRTVLRALVQDDAYRAAPSRRIDRFRRSYPRLIRVGWVLLIAQPLATFAVMVLLRADIDVKLILMAAMVVGIIAVDGYLIVVEYVNARLDSRLRLASLDRDDLLRATKEDMESGGGAVPAIPAPTPAAGATAPAGTQPAAPDDGEVRP